MLDLTNLGYDRIRQNLPTWGHSDNARNTRVGDAWLAWYDSFGYEIPALNFHDDDGSHQSGLGSYLGAAAIYETITGISTVGKAFTGSYQNGVSGSYDGSDIRVLLQQQATALAGASTPSDSDDDGLFDSQGNCVLIANTAQRDTDADDFGNVCDADLNNDHAINVVDLGLLRTVFFDIGVLDADFNRDGVVNVINLAIMKVGFLGMPGPSGLAP